MIRINLLKAHEIQKTRGQYRFLQGTVLAFLALGVAILVCYWVLGKQIQSLERVKIDLENQTRVFTSLQKELKTLKEQREISKNKLSILKTLEKDRRGPVRLMENLSAILPVNQLWLTSLKETGVETRLEGIALSNEILADFMKKLESTHFFTQVDLIQSIQGVYKNVKVKQFVLTAWSGPPPEPKGEKK
ncbi:MAG TPA: PilN domain-containing protein [Thermodesulfobacteriota bacterium]|nr:PilN domain-containing protein [Thermodesulfobacteriota bacterium]